MWPSWVVSGDGLLLGFWLGLAWEGVVMSRRRRLSMPSPQSIVCGVHHDHGIMCTVLRILGKVRVVKHLVVVLVLLLVLIPMLVLKREWVVGGLDRVSGSSRIVHKDCAWKRFVEPWEGGKRLALGTVPIVHRGCETAKRSCAL